MARTLVDIYGIREENVVILSQYRLQCARISKALETCGKKNISVRTVVKSQGRGKFTCGAVDIKALDL